MSDSGLCYFSRVSNLGSHSQGPPARPIFKGGLGGQGGRPVEGDKVYRYQGGLVGQSTLVKGGYRTRTV